MAHHRSDDPNLNDDSQPSVTNSTEALRQADLAAGVSPAVVAVKPPADVIDMEVRKAKADVPAEEVAAGLVPVGEGTDAGAEAMEVAEEDFGDTGSGAYEDRTVAQLQATADKKGLDRTGVSSKDDLIALLRGE